MCCKNDTELEILNTTVEPLTASTIQSTNATMPIPFPTKGPEPSDPAVCDFENRPKGWCHAAGDPHYISYDGTKFDFMGTCRYLLTGVDENLNGNQSEPMPSFRVEVGHRRAWNSKVYSYFSFSR